MVAPLINTIIFDMGGVIFKNGTREAINVLTSKYNVEAQIAHDIYNGSLSWDLRAGLLSSDIYWAVVQDKYGKYDFWNKLNLKELWYEQFTPLSGMLELLNSLNGKARLGIISGNIEDRVEYLFKKYKLRQLFNFEAYSFTFNLHKNDPNLYKGVIEKFNINAKNALFIDDNLDCLEAANQCELRTYLFKDSHQLKQEIIKYGI